MGYEATALTSGNGFNQFELRDTFHFHVVHDSESLTASDSVTHLFKLHLNVMKKTDIYGETSREGYWSLTLEDTLVRSDGKGDTMVSIVLGDQTVTTSLVQQGSGFSTVLITVIAATGGILSSLMAAGVLLMKLAIRGQYMTWIVEQLFMVHTVADEPDVDREAGR